MTTTLITGGDGHIGRALARRLLDNGDSKLLLFVRAANADEWKCKRDRLGTLASDPRCRVHLGDLLDDEPFATVDTSDITAIFHCAARIDFNVERASAVAVNIDGTEKTLAFAARCDKLRRFGLVSSLYAAGLRDGALHEVPFEEAPAYANHYEWSKWQAECLVMQQPELPWQIYRLSTVAGDDASGLVSQQNAIHNTLRLLYYGLLSVLPGHRDTRVYTVTTEFVTRAIDSLHRRGERRAIYHLSDAGSDAVTLGELTGIAYAAFLDDPAFARRRVLPPLFCGHEDFADLVAGAERFGGAVAQSLQSIAPFARQLYSDKDVRTEQSTRSLRGERTPDAHRLLDHVARRLVQTRWGLRGNLASESRGDSR
ncbi:MAG: SDR family oxidoreductase [Woeseiaceae bacterium]|nr:SDR family oxidoreductase [Woeseiaceae bacterium]